MVRIAIDERGKIGGRAEIRSDKPTEFRKRDWRRLRELLLVMEDKKDAARFLRDAGFRLQARGQFDPEPWTEAMVTDAIYKRLSTWQRFIRTLLTMSDAEVMKLGKQRDVEAEKFCGGLGDALNFHASVSWARTGRPEMAMLLNHPLQAVLLTAHLDRSFGEFFYCADPNCPFHDKPQRRIKPNQRFCEGGACSNRVRQQRKRKKDREEREKPDERL